MASLLLKGYGPGRSTQVGKGEEKMRKVGS
jgi:hypothetical protein